MRSIVINLNYHYWANKRMLHHLSKLDPGLFTKEVKNTFPSIANIFEHIFQVDTLWLKRLQGLSQPNIESVMFENPSVALQSFEQLFQQFSLVVPEKSHITYINTKGEVFQNTWEEIIAHIVNHGTYHRGNISSILHQIGERSVSTDYIFFLRDQ
ncbi:DinB family protein [Neobacillus sp. LXY-1]|uniref:DinB family protein n=1 Tax=Neobacillus sp. LXY-1 TaxID=3379133 RepID=UPI003EE0AE40